MAFTKFDQFTLVNTINTGSDFIVGYRNNGTTEYEVKFPLTLFNTSTLIGNLSDLTTTDKDTIVDAINEVNANKITKTSLSAESPINYNSSTGTFSILQSTSTTNGYLVASDWNTFNNKQASITLTTTNHSGSATFSNNVLNIPTYTAVGLGALTNITGLLSAGANISISGSGTSVNPYIISSSGNYALPIASQSVLGGIKVGNNLSIDVTGILNNTYTYTLPVASQSTLGGIKVGNNLAIDVTGVLNNTYTYTLPIASASTLGGIKIGSNVNIDSNGVISVAAPYSLPTASQSTLGGIKVGTNLSIVDGVLSSNNESITFTTTGDISGTTIGSTTLTPNLTVAKINGTTLGTLTSATNGQVLTWNGSSWIPADTVSVLQTIVPLNTDAITYTLMLNDGGTTIETFNTNNLSIIIPTNTSVAFPIGTEINILRHNTTTITFQADSGVTILSRNGLLSIGHQYAGASLIKRATNEWYLIGDLS